MAKRSACECACSRVTPLRHPGESRDPVSLSPFHRSSWVPAFAGTTDGEVATNSAMSRRLRVQMRIASSSSNASRRPAESAVDQHAPRIRREKPLQLIRRRLALAIDRQIRRRLRAEVDRMLVANPSRRYRRAAPHSAARAIAPAADTTRRPAGSAARRRARAARSARSPASRNARPHPSTPSPSTNSALPAR